MDKERFAVACERAQDRAYPRETVGLLSEKTLHSALKYYYEPDLAFHEQKIGPYFADIAKNGRIVEIQTAAFGRLKEKLSLFLSEYKVTVVYPIPAAKHLSWINAESGEIVSRRLVSRKGRFYDAGRELYRLASLLPNENLEIHLLLIDMEEHRLLDGWGRDKKRGSHRVERIPTALADTLVLSDRESFFQLLPKDMPVPFTAKELKRKTGTGPRVSSALLALLLHLEVIERVGKEGRAYLYAPKK